MSGRRSGRLFVVTLSLAALAALFTGVADGAFTVGTQEYDWSLPALSALLK